MGTGLQPSGESILAVSPQVLDFTEGNEGEEGRQPAGFGFTGGNGGEQSGQPGFFFSQKGTKGRKAVSLRDSGITGGKSEDLSRQRVDQTELVPPPSARWEGRPLCRPRRIGVFDATSLFFSVSFCEKPAVEWLCYPSFPSVKNQRRSGTVTRVGGRGRRSGSGICRGLSTWP